MTGIILVMTDPTEADKVDKSDISRENIFQIMDGIITQLNKTKKMFIIMILTIMIIPPIAFALTFALFGPPFHFDDDREPPQGFDDSPPHSSSNCFSSNCSNTSVSCMVRDRNKTVVRAFKVE